MYEESSPANLALLMAIKTIRFHENVKVKNKSEKKCRMDVFNAASYTRTILSFRTLKIVFTCIKRRSDDQSIKIEPDLT